MDELKENVRQLLTRFDKFEKTVTNIDERVSILANQLNKQVLDITKKVDDIENSQKFINSQYEKQKKATDYIMTEEKLRKNEHKILTDKINRMDEQLKAERSTRNVMAQYDRSSFQVKILGLPQQDGEDKIGLGSNKVTEKVVTNLLHTAGVANFQQEQIDVAHRVPPRRESDTPAVIIRFTRKNDRMNLYGQRQLLRNVELDPDRLDEMGADIVFRRKPTQHDREVTFRGEGKPIILVEALTEMNGELLNLARNIAKPLEYTYPGYTVKGQVRVKKNKDSKVFIAINNKDDLEKIV